MQLVPEAEVCKKEPLAIVVAAFAEQMCTNLTAQRQKAAPNRRLYLIKNGFV